MNGMYAIMNIVGPVLLGAVLLYAVISNRKKNSPADIEKTEQATRRLHDELDREDKARSATPEPSTSVSGKSPKGGPRDGITRPNLSTDHQPAGGARYSRDTLDREPERDPLSQGSIPDNYDPATSKRKSSGLTAADSEAARVARRGRQ